MQSFFTFLVVLLFAIITTWLKNQKARSSNDNSPPGQAKPPPQPGATSWEAELRRLLNDEQAPSPPPLPRPPRPIATSQAPPRPAAPPVVIKPVLVPRRPPPAPVRTPASAPSEIEVSAGQMAPMRESRQAYQRAQDLEQGISKGELAPLTESRQAYQRASELGKTMSQHIERVSGQRVLATTVTRRASSPEVAQVVGLFRNARTTRQAVIAAVILGPPRSLDETPVVSRFS